MCAVYGTKFKIDKKYAPIKALGKGAYGVVCAAKNKDTGGKVAIKKITPMCSTTVDGKHVSSGVLCACVRGGHASRVRTRGTALRGLTRAPRARRLYVCVQTLREIRLMRHLGRHPNIISLKDLVVNAAEDELYVVMELMDTDLHRIIQSPQPLGDAHFKHFLFQLLRGLRFAHGYGVIHRDLKPANLLVTKNCDLCISDFGLARQMPERGPSLMTEVRAGCRCAGWVAGWLRAPHRRCPATTRALRATAARPVRISRPSPRPPARPPACPLPLSARRHALVPRARADAVGGRQLLGGH